MEYRIDLLHAFWYNHKTSFLEESISLLCQVLKMPGTKRSIRLWAPYTPSGCLFAGSCLITGTTYACFWTYVPQVTRHLSISIAYETAMSWMQKSLVFTLTLHTQHAHLVSIQSANKMPLWYASYHVETGRLEQAIETLEQRRALLSSEMGGLRTSIDELNRARPGSAL